jgi:hypothetical protein
LQNGFPISRLAGSGKPGGSGILFLVDVVGSGMATEFGMGLSLA